MLLSNLDILATAPGGVARLRELILTLAVQGKLVPQDPADEPASVLLQKTRAEKDRLIAEGKIRRDKPLAEIAEEEKPFEVADGVGVGALGRDAIRQLRGVTFQKADAK
jgi:type I restriction enzyme S subunit